MPRIQLLSDPPSSVHLDPAVRHAFQLDQALKVRALLRDKASTECPCCFLPWAQNPSSRVVMSHDTFCGHTACRKCYNTYLTVSEKPYGYCMICRGPAS